MRRANILSVGTELVTGQTVDTNASWIARRLGEWHPERLEAVEVQRISRELEGLDRNRRSYSLDEGGGLAVFCDPEDALLALRLFVEAPFGCECSHVRISAASVEGPSGWTQVRVERALNARATPPAPDSTLVRLAERLAERIVADRLHGELHVDPDGAWAEIRLPQPAATLGETLVLPR